MRELRTTPCRACRRPIHFIRMKSGSLMPCEVEEFIIAPGADGKIESFVTDDGELRKGVRVEARMRGDMFAGYRPHWQHCPQFRNGKK